MEQVYTGSCSLWFLNLNGFLHLNINSWFGGLFFILHFLLIAHLQILMSVKFRCDFNLIKKTLIVQPRSYFCIFFLKNTYTEPLPCICYSIQANLQLRNAYTVGGFVCVWVKGNTSNQLQRISLIFFSFIFHLLGFHFSRHPSRHFIFTVQPNN